MPYAILRFQKKKAGSIAACERHNERKKEAYASNPDIDLARAKDNYHLISPPKYTYKKEIGRQLKEANCRIRKDSTVLVETLVTASPEFLAKLSHREQEEYFDRALSFLEERVGKEHIVSAVVHMDEKTPHMHLCFIPLTKDNRLSAKSILGNQKTLSEWQSAFHEHMSGAWPELERGQSSMDTKRKHIPTWVFKKAQKLDRERAEIETLISGMTMLNMSKTKEQLFERLPKFRTEAAGFSAELEKYKETIESVKRIAEQTEKENTALEQENFGKDLEILQLEETNHKLQCLLAEVPEEFWERFAGERSMYEKEK